MSYAYLLPVASLLEITGILTLITNQSITGPIDIGFTIPYLISANFQGIALFIAGSLLTAYAILKIKR